MPARGNIALSDGEATPIVHTFVPDGDVGVGHARFVNANVTVPAASEFVFVEVKRSNAKPEDYSTPGRKVQPSIVKTRILYPATYTDAVSGLTLVDFVDESETKNMYHPRSSTQRRENMRYLNANLWTAIGVGVNDAGIAYY